MVGLPMVSWCNVHFNVARDTPVGTLSGQPGRLWFRPSAITTIIGDPDTMVVNPPFDVEVPPDGLVTIPLRVTNGSWAWIVWMTSLEGKRIWGPVHVAVAADPEADWPDLPRVDPATLAPEAEPEAAWWAALELAALSLDGGSPSTVFTLDQHIDGGVA